MGLIIIYNFSLYYSSKISTLKKTLVLLIIGLITLASCKNRISEEKLVGTWRVIDYSANMPDISHMIIIGAKELALSEVYVINADGSYQLMDSYKDKPQWGKWTLNTDGDEPYIKLLASEIDQPMQFIILSCSESKMVWQWNDKELGSSEYTLQKD